jgi:hypothetical protein
LDVLLLSCVTRTAQETQRVVHNEGAVGGEGLTDAPQLWVLTRLLLGVEGSSWYKMHLLQTVSWSSS